MRYEDYCLRANILVEKFIKTWNHRWNQQRSAFQACGLGASLPLFRFLALIITTDFRCVSSSLLEMVCKSASVQVSPNAMT